MRTSEQIQEIATALATAQGLVEMAKKDSTNPHFRSKYADLSEVFKAGQAALKTAGLALTFDTQHTQGVGVTLTPLLLHKSGQFIEYSAFTVRTKDDTAQGQGSAITYGRRYLYQTILGIAADEDDDGNGASSEPREQKTQPKPVEAPKKAQEKKEAPAVSGEELEYRAQVAEYIKEATIVMDDAEKDRLRQAFKEAGVDRVKLDKVKDLARTFVGAKTKPEGEIIIDEQPAATEQPEPASQQEIW